MFIVFEGGEGSGKDTHIDLLREHFRDRSDIVYTREPGGTTIGERIRAVLMDPDHAHMAVETELLMFLASRAQLLAEVIRPALAQGQHVISNRFALSTVAYQIFRKERPQYRRFLDAISTELMSDIDPHYVLLDVEPKTGLARARARTEAATRFDLEEVDVHERVRVGYHDAIQAFSHVIVDANRPLPEVHADVRTHITNKLGV